LHARFLTPLRKIDFKHLPQSGIALLVDRLVAELSVKDLQLFGECISLFQPVPHVCTRQLCQLLLMSLFSSGVSKHHQNKKGYQTSQRQNEIVEIGRFHVKKSETQL